VTKVLGSVDAVLAAPPPRPPIVVVDPAGDNGTAPDITKVTVTTKKSGIVTFIVVFKTPFGKDSSLYVYFGTNGWRLGPGGLEVWDPPANEYEPLGSESGTFSVAPGGRALEASCSLADLGNPTTFRFTVQSLDGDGGAGHMDVTPAAVWRRPAH
jgi:outer membrane protein assembly factor BamB